MLVEYGMDIIRADFHLHTKQDKKFKYEGLDYVNVICPLLGWGCGHFLGLAKPPSQGFSCTPTGSCFQGISLSAFRYTISDIHSVCQ